VSFSKIPSDHYGIRVKLPSV